MPYVGDSRKAGLISLFPRGSPTVIWNAVPSERSPSAVLRPLPNTLSEAALVKAPLDYDVSSAIAEALARVGEERGISISVDVDPYDLM